MWTKALKSDNYLYVVDQFDIKTVEEDVAKEFLVESINSDNKSYSIVHPGPSDPLKNGVK